MLYSGVPTESMRHHTYSDCEYHGKPCPYSHDIFNLKRVLKLVGLQKLFLKCLKTRGLSHSRERALFILTMATALSDMGVMNATVADGVLL